MSTQTGSISFESTKGIHNYAKQNFSTLSQVLGQFATCGTGTSTTAKVATIVPENSNWTLQEGTTVTVTFSSANTTTTPTLNVNGTGAKQIRDSEGNELTKAAREWAEGAAIAFTYDGTYWRIQDSNLMERVHTAETEIEQTANNVLIKATENDTTAAQGGQHLIESFINVAPSGVTISADKVNIEGATIFTGNGRLSQTSLNNAYDAKGAASTAEQNAKSYTDTNAAPKTSAVSRTQRIYYQSASTTKPTTPGTASSNWVSDETGAADKWTLKRMSYSSAKPYIYTCEQKQVVSGTVSYTPVLLDDTTTVIDGGKIITGSVTANALNATNINASKTLTIGAFQESTQNDILNSNIQVGGKNLLYNSSIITGSDYGSLSSSPIDGGTAGSEKHVESTNAWNGIGIALHTALQRAGAKIGDTVTMSIWVSNTSTEAISRDIYLYRAKTSSSTPGVNNPGGTNTYTRLSLKSGEWQRVYVTFEVTDYALNTVKTTRFETSVTDSTNKMLWTAPQLEFGNVVTDWRPAPEDTEASIEELSSYTNSIRNWYATCPTAAATAAKVATIDPATTDFTTSILTPGTVVFVKFTITNSAAVGDLTLNVNNTGAKPIRQVRNGTVQTIPGVGYLAANATYQFTYDGTNWLYTGNYDSNSNDNARYVQFYNTIVAGEALADASIIGAHTDGKFYQVKENASFDLASPLLWLTTALAANATNYANIYTQCYDRNLATFYTSFVANTANRNKIVYLVGTVSGNTFTTYGSNSSQYLTCTPPTTEDGRFYIPIGRLGNQSSGKNYFNYQVGVPVSLYAYIDGKFRQVTPTEIVATQKIYYRSKVSGNVPVPTTWITANGNIYNDTISVGTNGWSTKVTPMSKDKTSNTDANKYLYLYTCEQRKRLDGTIECLPNTNALLDESTTIIDGGNIITGSITANQIAANSITADEIDATNLKVKAANIEGTITFGQLSGVQASGDYALNSDIPTKVSDLTNDSGFQTSSQVETAITSKGYATNTNLTTEINQRKAQYGTCNTAATTQAKVVTCANFELVAGNELTVKFSTANTYASGAVQLNVNSKGAKNVWVGNAITSTTNKLLWGANAYITFRYDGTQFIVIGEPRTWYGACNTAEGTAAKTDTTAVTGCVICKGTKVELAMTNANTADAPTLNIQSTGALAIYFGTGTTRPTKVLGTSWLAANTCTFTFDGTTWRTQGKTYIDANSIVTGYISADRIEGGSLSIGKINGLQDSLDEKANSSDLNAQQPFVIDTQTTATRWWRAECPELSELVDGQQLTIWLSHGHANSTAESQSIAAAELTPTETVTQSLSNSWLNLTLADGSKTGWIPLYYSGSTRMTLHYGANNSVHLTYRTNAISGVPRGWWGDANYDSNTYGYGYLIYLSGKTSADRGIWQSQLFMEDNAGTYQGICTASDGTITTSNRPYNSNATTFMNNTKAMKANPAGFKVGKTIYYLNGGSQNKAANLNGWGQVYTYNSNIIDSRYSFNPYGTGTSLSLTANTPIYLVGTINSDGLFYLDTVWHTQSPTDISKVYIFVGNCYDNYRFMLAEQNTWLKYDGTKLVEYEKWLADEAALVADNYIHADSTGINIYDSNLANASKYYLRQTAGGTYIYRNSYLKAKYEDTITLYGGSNANGANPKVELTSSQFKMTDSGGVQRLLLDSSSGAIIGKPDKGRIQVTDTSMTIYDTNNKKRTTVDASGLTIYDASATPVDIANFGSTVGTTGTTAYARIGLANSSRFEVTPTSLRAYTSTSTTPFFEVTSTSLKYGTNTAETTAGAQSKADEAAGTATNYIADIDSNKGITVKPSDSSGNDYLQMNSTDIRFVRNNVDVMNLTDSSFRIGQASGYHTTVNTSGLHIWSGAESTTTNEVASFGSTARVGKTNSSRFLMNADSLQGYNSSNKLYFEVSSSGIKYGTDLTNSGTTYTAATTTQVSESNNAANTIVTVYPTAIDYAAGTATLAVKCMRGTTAITPSAYLWTKGTATTSIGTNSTLQVTDLNAVYNCTVTIAV